MYQYTKNADGEPQNASPRLYLLGDDGNYEMLKLLGQELTFTVDLSTLPCGENGALYLGEMDKTGGRNPYNTGGASYGSGYCDAQCPVQTWKNGTLNTNASGYCCNEMDSKSLSNHAHISMPLTPCRPRASSLGHHRQVSRTATAHPRLHHPVVFLQSIYRVLIFCDCQSWKLTPERMRLRLIHAAIAIAIEMAVASTLMRGDTLTTMGQAAQLTPPSHSRLSRSSTPMMAPHPVL